MKRLVLGMLTCVIAISVGFSTTALINSALTSSETSLSAEIADKVPAIPVEIVGGLSEKVPIVGFCDPPEVDPDIDYAKHLKVKLLMAGNFHNDEVPYRSGEKWLGLFQTATGFELARTSIKIDRGDADDPFNTEVMTTRTGESLFLLRGASNLRPGPIETVFHSRFQDFVSFSETGNRKSYVFRDIVYSLEIDGANPDGHLQEGSSLTLNSGDISQTITYLYQDCDDCGWTVEWVGDLDRDGKLDFLLDLSNHYNRYNPTLFLSTSVKDGKLVGVYAGFAGVGC